MKPLNEKIFFLCNPGLVTIQDLLTEDVFEIAYSVLKRVASVLQLDHWTSQVDLISAL